MRRRQVCEARAWTSAVLLSCAPSTRSGARDRELDGASHTEAGPRRADGLAALLPDRNPSAQLGRVYARRGSCLAATSERPRADRRADCQRPDERPLPSASSVARIGGVIQERTLRPAFPSNPATHRHPLTLRSIFNCRGPWTVCLPAGWHQAPTTLVPGGASSLVAARPPARPAPPTSPPQRRGTGWGWPGTPCPRRQRAVDQVPRRRARWCTRCGRRPCGPSRRRRGAGCCAGTRPLACGAGVVRDAVEVVADDEHRAPTCESSTDRCSGRRRPASRCSRC